MSPGVTESPMVRITIFRNHVESIIREWDSMDVANLKFDVSNALQGG